MTEIDNNVGVSRPEYMLSTVDNPYDPFDQFDDWYQWDQNAGYCTPGLLARLAYVSDEISEADQHLAVQQAIEEIVTENVSGVHIKLERGSFIPLSPQAEDDQEAEE